MKNKLAMVFVLAMIGVEARSDSLSYFTMTSEFGEALAADGDPVCLNAFKNMVEDFKKIPPVAHDYLLYNGGIRWDREQGSVNPNDQSFQVGLHDELFGPYRYERIFSGTFLRTSGRVEITAIGRSKPEGCHLVYDARFTYSN